MGNLPTHRISPNETTGGEIGGGEEKERFPTEGVSERVEGQAGRRGWGEREINWREGSSIYRRRRRFPIISPPGERTEGAKDGKRGGAVTLLGNIDQEMMPHHHHPLRISRDMEETKTSSSSSSSEERQRRLRHRWRRWREDATGEFPYNLKKKKRIEKEIQCQYSP